MFKLKSATLFSLIISGFLVNFTNSHGDMIFPDSRKTNSNPLAEFGAGVMNTVFGGGLSSQTVTRNSDRNSFQYGIHPHQQLQQRGSPLGAFGGSPFDNAKINPGYNHQYGTKTHHFKSTGMAGDGGTFTVKKTVVHSNQPVMIHGGLTRGSNLDFVLPGQIPIFDKYPAEGRFKTDEGSFKVNTGYSFNGPPKSDDKYKSIFGSKRPSSGFDFEAQDHYGSDPIVLKTPHHKYTKVFEVNSPNIGLSLPQIGFGYGHDGYNTNVEGNLPTHGTDTKTLTGAFLNAERFDNCPQITAKYSLMNCKDDFCTVECNKGYAFRSGAGEMKFTCRGGNWIVDDTIQITEMPECGPVCAPNCQNGGSCIGPGLCSCMSGYTGKYCQQKKVFCESTPQVMNAKIVCTNSKCEATCREGYILPDRRVTAQLICDEDGLWKDAQTGHTHIPDCKPTCNPGCENGGDCISLNLCKCYNLFRGPQCQYDSSVCNITMSSFNGLASCKYTQNEVSCMLSCPPQAKFEVVPASQYNCKYGENVFNPPIPQCIYERGIQVIGGETSKIVHEQGLNKNIENSEDVVKIIEKKKTLITELDDVYTLYVKTTVELKEFAPAVCLSWAGSNIKTFDGLIYRTPIHCAHTLVQDVEEEITIIQRICPPTAKDCQQAILIYFDNILYTFASEGRNVKLSTPDSQLPVPVQILGMKVIQIADYIKIEFDRIGITVMWDLNLYVAIEASSKLHGRVAGLCGTFDNDRENDFASRNFMVLMSLKEFIDEWKLQSKEEQSYCVGLVVEEFEQEKCDEVSVNKAKEICSRLILNKKLKQCSQTCNKESLLKFCIDNFCSCPDKRNRKSCACETISMWAKECAFKGIKLEHGWRDLEICPPECPKGRVYSPCGPEVVPSCGSVQNVNVEVCHEGCYCPEGYVQHGGECIDRERCPCTVGRKEYKQGDVIKKGCNNCTCDSGTWQCTEDFCGARCSAIGDPHYTTFDGKRFDFMGKCTYYLVKTDNVSIEAENVPCPGSISTAMNLPPSLSAGLPSCTKSISIRLTINGKPFHIKLGQELSVFVNDKEVLSFPKKIGYNEVVIREASSSFISVLLPNGIEVKWDGDTRVYVDAPPSLRDKTQGLCGTFNSNTQDDFLTPENDVEPNADAFAEKWRTNDKCEFDSNTPTLPNTCDSYPENREKAEKQCDILLSEIFEDCHFSVGPETFYENCMVDVCACQGEVSSCLCPIFSSYAAECARQDVVIDWRSKISICSTECPPGEVFEECGDGCARSCQDLSLKENCDAVCVEGCRCPKEQYLNENGECVPRKQCPCWYEGISFKANHKEIRPGINGSEELCTCTEGEWYCKPATIEEKKNYPLGGEYKNLCLEIPFSEFVKCAPSELKTCKNMHIYTEDLEDCEPGCVCRSDYVYDQTKESCVLPKDCSCHHAGRSYNDGDEITEDCNKCKCKSGRWDCTNYICPSTCTVWGDSHFTTFDNTEFDYQGACDYILSKGTSENGDGFTITIQNVLCGSMGVTCSKSVKISLSGNVNDTLTLSSDPADMKSIESFKKYEDSSPHSFSTYNVGLFLVVEVKHLGLQVKWDRGTRVYVKLDSKWKQKVSGLCGNYNDNAQDDMKTPAFSVETSPMIFGHSWRLGDYCATPTEPIDACKKHPERESWSHLKCGIIKSHIFKDCHSEVPYEKYLKRCIFDSCACDQGGDCECLCTAISSYAHACALKGVHVKWRTPHLCPMQCDPHCSEYNSCVKPCPIETCENFLEQGTSERMCMQESCFEGCQIKLCGEGLIYTNDSYIECVPKAQCKPICMQKNGITYYEGDITRIDECQTCRCTRKKEVCSGAPCSTPLPGYTTPRTVATTPFEKECDPTHPHYEHPEDCHKFYHCETKSDGRWRYVEKTCGSTMMYNPKNMICDHIYVVKMQKPECATIQLTTTTTPRPIQHMCNRTEPPKESDHDCYSYYECVNVKGSWVYVEKQCLDGTMFDPIAKRCSDASTVVLNKPICQPPVVTGPPTECPPGQKWSECGIPCEESCHYYKNLLIKDKICFQGDYCEAGCVDMEKMQSCTTEGKTWRDDQTCIERNECPCMNPEGQKIKPGETFEKWEFGKCDMCQCLDNKITCRECNIGETTRNPYTTVTMPPIMKTTHKSQRCPEEKLIPLIDGYPRIPDKAFSASSILGPAFQSFFARLSPKGKNRNIVHWSPMNNDNLQYLQIAFAKPVQVFGVEMQGNPLLDQYVKRYEVAYSIDGEDFEFVTDDSDNPEIFKGPESSKNAEISYFHSPVEAKYIRIYPSKWHGAIALRLELYGCLEMITTPSIITAFTPPPPPKDIIIPCNEAIGAEVERLRPEQIKASSIRWPPTFGGKKPKLVDLVRLSSPFGWRPVLDTNYQHITFDFYEPRNITGMMTKGGPDGWVTSYLIAYSQNDKLWNKIVNPNGKPLVFGANHDTDTPNTNYFMLPIQARYLKLMPLTWYNTINLRLEPLGCFQSDIITTTLPPVTYEDYGTCPICPEVETVALKGEKEENCKCQEPLYWNGTNCVVSNLCPCVSNHQSYQAGSKYENEYCEQCICTLGGISQCQEKVCPPCGEGLRRNKAKPCQCLCERCPQFYRVCPSSGDCILESLWCNGYQDCEDDELEENCKEKLTTTTPPPPAAKIVECPRPRCQPGMKVQLTNNTRKLSPMFESSFHSSDYSNKYVQSFKETDISEDYIVPLEVPDLLGLPSTDCVEYICVYTTQVEKCSEPQCPEGYELQEDASPIVRQGDCPSYTCVPPPQKDRVCKISGKTFLTFDGLEFKTDICNHVLARDITRQNWMVIMNINCTAKCQKELVIRDKVNRFVLTILPTLSIKFNGYIYGAATLEKSSLSQFEFTLSQTGNTILFISKAHGFWVSYEDNGDVRIGMSLKYALTVDGLCGFFDDDKDNDMRLPNGKVVPTVEEFVEAWYNKEIPTKQCQPAVCGTGTEKTAWDICNSIKDEVFKPCSKFINYQNYLSKCVEATCECLRFGRTRSGMNCKCAALERFVKECRTLKPDIELATWRTIHNCEVSCASPFVYKECYKRRCEPSCSTLLKNECPIIPGTCFSGCFCPEGMVRKEDTCVSVHECRDCSCDVFGMSKFVTYDYHNFTFQGNCTYLLSRDISLPGKHNFQIYATLSGCNNNNKQESKKISTGFGSSCAKILHIVHENHIATFEKGPNDVVIKIDDVKQTKIPVHNNWLDLKQIGSSEMQLTLMKANVEVVISLEDFLFSIRVPSSKYKGKMEGICGDCDGDPNNDLRLNIKTTRKLTGNAFTNVIESWVTEDTKLGGDPSCLSENIAEEECILPDPEVDVCMKILDKKTFGKCHVIVNPMSYLSACQQDTYCSDVVAQKSACESLAAYARECLRKGICVDWRKGGVCPYKCDENLEYKPCGCLETCESLNKGNDIFDVIDIRTDIVINNKQLNDDDCQTQRIEGCFCLEGEVFKNGMCIDEKECFACDEDGHYSGDFWMKDKCTECTCDVQGQVRCVQKECSTESAICPIGYVSKQIENDEECCPKYFCSVEFNTTVDCPESTQPKCGKDQIVQQYIDNNNCTTFVCKCIATSECKMSKIDQELKPGEKIVTDSSGCCPVDVIKCDVSTCPVKPKSCEKEFFEVSAIKEKDACCTTYKCAPPKGTCTVEIDGRTVLKKFNEKWSDNIDPCLKYVCSIGLDGNSKIIEEQEMCDMSCSKGFKYTAEKGKCCGKCKQVTCIVEENVYKPGDVWRSEDNCTEFKCIDRDGVLSISPFVESCPDISNCPKEQIYFENCCDRCRLVAEALSTCVSESLAEYETINLIKIYQPIHGICTNKEAIRGFTECHGTCESGSKYNPRSYLQDKYCNCCSIKEYKVVEIPLTCVDGFKISKKLEIPSKCGCKPCEDGNSSYNEVWER